jgi:hypothetical protein
MVNDEQDRKEQPAKVRDLSGLKSLKCLKNTKWLVFRIFSGTETDFFSQETHNVTYDLVQLKELISNITLVLRQQILMLAKLVIPGHKPGFFGDLSLTLYSLMQHGAMISDKSHMEA